jgi:two-component system sensor histidine kinase VanS
MESRRFIRLKLKLLLYVVISSLTIWGIGLLFLQFVVDGLMKGGIRRAFYWLAQNWAGMGLYQAKKVYATYITANKPVILAVILVFIVLFNCYLSYSLFARYLNQIGHAAHQLFDESEEALHLPPELSPIEADLNGVRRAISAKRNLSHSTEQRKNDLIAYLAHDLKTPLTSALGYLELLQSQPDLPQDQRAKYVGIALDKTQRLEKLLGEFFNITQMELSAANKHYTEVRLDLLLYQLAEEFYPMLEEKNLTCQPEIQEGFVVNGDADQLARTFDNLLRNAVSYSTSGTPIRLVARVEQGWVEVAISNQGLGIPEEQLASIFEKFYRLDEARQTHTGGSGLGLAIAKEIVELHGGSIQATSTSNLTTFTVRLPGKPVEG